jgi:hypothetical protein
VNVWPRGKDPMGFLSSVTIVLAGGLLFELADSCCAELVFDKREGIMSNAVQGVIVSFPFVLTNTGDETLEIIDIKKHCGCTSIDLESKALRPHSSQKVTAQVDTKSYAGWMDTSFEVAWRQQGKTEENRVEISLRVNVATMLRADTTRCDFGTVEQDQDDPPMIPVELLRGNADESWDELDLQTSPHLELDYIKLAPDRYVLHVMLKPWTLPAGKFTDEIAIGFKNKGRSVPGKIVLGVRAMIKTTVAAHPTALYFGTLAKRTEDSAEITIESRNSQRLRFVSAQTSDPSFIKASIEKVEDTSILLRCAVKAGERQETKSGQLTIVVKSDKERAINVPYLAYVQ